MAKKTLTFEQAVKNVNQWINIRNAQTDTPTIDIDGEIGDDWWGEGENTTKAIKNKIKEIGNLKAKKIIVNINSLGGSVTHGLGIHDILAGHKAEIETNVQGMTASAATIIAQAGDVRKISDNALYLIHQPWSVFISNVSELKQNLADMETINDRLIKIYTKRSGQPEEKIRGLMDEANGNGKWIDAQEAKDMGLIDEIYEPMKAAAGIKKQLEHLATGPDAFLDKLPEIPNEKINMKITTKATDKPGEAGMTVTAEEETGLRALLSAAKKFFGSEEEETEETESDAAEETEETEATTEDVNSEEPEATEETEEGETEEEAEEGETEEEAEEEAEATDTQASADAAAATAAAIKQKDDEIAALKVQLAKAGAKSTKPKGPEGLEGNASTKNAEQMQLEEDLKKLQNTWNGDE